MTLVVSITSTLMEHLGLDNHVYHVHCRYAHMNFSVFTRMLEEIQFCIVL